MKKIIALILSAVILSALCVCANAAATEYPMYSKDGMSEGVTLYINGEEVAFSRIKASLDAGGGWPACCIGVDSSTDGTSSGIGLLAWAKGGHMHFDGVRLTGSSSLKIVFTGTSIALRTNYREEGQGNWAEPTVKLDGKEITSTYNTLGTTVAENKAFVEATGLENKCHTLEVVSNGDLEFDVIEIDGVLGNHEENAPSTADALAVAVAVVVLAGTGVVLASKKH